MPSLLRGYGWWSGSWERNVVEKVVRAVCSHCKGLEEFQARLTGMNKDFLRPCLKYYSGAARRRVDLIY